MLFILGVTAEEVKGIVWLIHISTEATSPSHTSGQRIITRVGAGSTYVSPPPTSNEPCKVSPSESMKISQRLWLWEATASRTPGSDRAVLGGVGAPVVASWNSMGVTGRKKSLIGLHAFVCFSKKCKRQIPWISVLLSS